MTEQRGASSAASTVLTGMNKTESDLNDTISTFKASQNKLNGAAFQMLNEVNDEIEELKKRQKDNDQAIIELLVGLVIVFLGEMAILFGNIF
ncbi:hypothetical protein [Weissella confusa]|uniref:hypothetical protein n=1 Tax=Weissella confusa TaxID=1583 RepID=UPI001081FFEC|nr:hypothetical protein [Weissella confusa]MED4273841.1 hypothetical protein [Weissella confusa]TGE69265.1 hypothetical protein C6P15_06415 [Weissella confusa]